MMYLLEVYEPGTTETVWEVFQTSSPFLGIHAGDLINPALWPDSRSPLKMLRVTSVEHVIWGKQGETKHKLMVFTEEVEGTHELRIPPR